MRVLITVFPFALALAGCSTYESKPLNAASVEHALGRPSMESVRDSALRLTNPLMAPMAIDGEGGFTPDEVAAMVVVVNPSLRAIRDQRGIAQAQVVAAGILPNPQLSYSVDRPYGANAVPVVPAKTLGLTWEITSLLTRHDHLASAKADAKAIDLTIAWQEWQSAQDARLKAYRILSLGRRIPLAHKNEDDLADALTLTRKAVEMGLRTTSELSLASENWRQAYTTRIGLEQQLGTEMAALDLLLGMPAGSQVHLRYSKRLSAAIWEEVPSANDLLNGLEDRRLDLVALRYGYESQEASLRAAVIAQFPKIGLGVNKSNDTTPVYTRGAAVTVDIPLFDRNQGQIAAGEATRQLLFDEYVARVAEARSEVGQVLADLGIVRAELVTVESTLPDLSKLVSSYETALRTRNADELAYLDTLSTYTARQIEKIGIEQQATELRIALEIATGRASID